MVRITLIALVLCSSLAAQDGRSGFSRERDKTAKKKEDAPKKKKKKTDYFRVIWFTWKWTFVDDLTEEEMEAKKQIVETWQTNLWKVGEGNFALTAVTIIDKSRSKGTMHTPEGLKEAGKLNGTTWARVRGGVMELPGQCDPDTFLHEVGHLLFGMPEEYDSPNGCPCVEATGAKGGKMQWCDASNHSAEQAKQHPPCWEGYILKRYPRARHPGPGGDRPDVRIVVQDH